MSVDNSAFGRRESDAFPATAPLRPIRPPEQDRQILPRPRNSSSGLDAGFASEIGHDDDPSSARQVSRALPTRIRKPIGLLLSSLLVKDLSACASTCKGGVPFLLSTMVSIMTCKSGYATTVLTSVADRKRDRYLRAIGCRHQ